METLLVGWELWSFLQIDRSTDNMAEEKNAYSYRIVSPDLPTFTFSIRAPRFNSGVRYSSE